MRNIIRLMAVTASLAGALGIAHGDNAAANEEYLKGEAAYKQKEFREASKHFQAAELYADDAYLKSNAIKASMLSFQKAKLHYLEFQELEKLISGFPSYINFSNSIRREYEIGDLFYGGHKDQKYKWFTWVRDTNTDEKTTEIYETALEHGPYSTEAPKVKLRLSRLYLKSIKNDKAIKTLEDLIKDHPDHEVAKYAHLELANISIQLAKNGDGDGLHAEKAQKVLQTYLAKYPNSQEKKWAATSLEEIKVIAAQRLKGVGDYYARLERPDIADKYYQTVVEDYPATETATVVEPMLKGSAASAEKLPASAATTPVSISKLKDVQDLLQVEHLSPEPERIVVAPENSNGKWLLPIKELPDTAKAVVSEEELERERLKEQARLAEERRKREEELKLSLKKEMDDLKASVKKLIVAKEDNTTVQKELVNSIKQHEEAAAVVPNSIAKREDTEKEIVDLRKKSAELLSKLKEKDTSLDSLLTEADVAAEERKKFVKRATGKGKALTEALALSKQKQPGMENVELAEKLISSAKDSITSDTPGDLDEYAKMLNQMQELKGDISVKTTDNLSDASTGTNVINELSPLSELKRKEKRLQKKALEAAQDELNALKELTAKLMKELQEEDRRQQEALAKAKTDAEIKTPVIPAELKEVNPTPVVPVVKTTEDPKKEKINETAVADKEPEIAAVKKPASIEEEKSTPMWPYAAGGGLILLLVIIVLAAKRKQK